MESYIKEYAEIHLLGVKRDLILYPDRYEFRKDRPPHLLQKAALWVLKTLRCYSQGEGQSLVAIKIHTPTFFDKFKVHYNQMMGDCRGEPKSILIGVKQFDEIREENSQFCGMFSFSMTDDTKFRRGRYGPVDVYVLPWMDGVLVLPHLLRNP
jgi:hypothetical protein